MNRKTIKEAVLDVAVGKFAFPPRTFSAYDITKQIRDDVNNDRYRVTEFDGKPSNHKQEIDHSTIRSTVETLYGENYFDRSNNGTFWEYAISINAPKAAPKPVLVGPLWDFIVKTVGELSGVANASVGADVTLDKYKLDDLDFVELIMAIEEETGTDIDESKLEFKKKDGSYITLREIYAVAVTSPVATKTTPVTAAVNAPPTVEDELKRYITPRHSKNINPSLKNAQKYLKGSGYTKTVSEIRTIAESLGFKVNYVNAKDAFNQWTIRKS